MIFVIIILIAAAFGLLFDGVEDNATLEKALAQPSVYESNPLMNWLQAKFPTSWKWIHLALLLVVDGLFITYAFFTDTIIAFKLVAILLLFIDITYYFVAVKGNQDVAN